MKAPCGSWTSPITTGLIASRSIGLDEIVLDGDDIYWLETRPAENGRCVIVRKTPSGEISDLLPPPFSARSRVHDYGGGAYTVSGGEIFFSNAADGRLYRLSPGGTPRPITPEGNYRYADLVFDPRRRRLICVREDHTGESPLPENTLVAIDPDGRRPVEVLFSGNDFYSSPRLSPDGVRLAFLTWNFPRMPWDGTELRLSELDGDGLPGTARLLAGGPAESVFQPEWSPKGVLYFISDRSGWWNIYKTKKDGIIPVCPLEAEFGLPQWNFGMSTYAFLSEEEIVCAFARKGIWTLGILSAATGRLREIPTPYTEITGIRAGGVGVPKAAFIASSPVSLPAVIRYKPGKETMEIIRSESEVEFDPGYLSSPSPIEFPTGEGETAYGFFYPPRNRDFSPSDGELPPLLVVMHTGPTGASGSALKLKIQFWTSRGWAVLDVNYRGSTGYGRKYRRRLYGQWGIADVEDCVRGAAFLARRGLVDRDRMAIRGGSAGGFTTLCALAFHDIFRVGAVYYGVSDLELLLEDTHKFEAKYLDTLVGPFPERRDLYYNRSPVHFPDKISCPVIFFQGMNDKVVPPVQTAVMVEALRTKKIRVKALYFDNEEHGFRRAETIRQALAVELFFYSRVLGFPGKIMMPPITIENRET